MINSSESKPLPTYELRTKLAPAAPPLASHAPRHEAAEVEETETEDRWSTLPCTD